MKQHMMCRRLLCLPASLLLAAGSVLPSSAQTPAGQASAVARARALESRLPAPQAPQGSDSFDLSAARQQRLQKLLPESWRKLKQRESFHILVLAGERELEIGSEDGQASAKDTFPAVFARELARQFYYTGGVVEPGKGGGAAGLAPAISLRVLSAPDQALVDAPAILGSVARQAPVDLVMICHGLHEADSGLSVTEWTRQMRLTLDAVNAMKAEAFIVAPWLSASEPIEAALASARPLADALAEAAEEDGWMFADLGDLTRLMALPPDDARDEARRFERFASTWRSFFHEDRSRRLLPRTNLHQRLGSQLFETLLDGAPAAAVQFESAFATWKENGQELDLRCTVVNGSTQEQRLTVLPLVTEDWKPREAQPEVVLAPATKKTLVVRYVKRSPGLLALSENLVRLPLLVLSSQGARVVTQRAPLQPVAVVWKTETLFNQEGRFVIGAQVANGTETEVRGTWEASYHEAKLSGSLQLAAGGTQPLDLTFDLPAAEAVVSHPILLKVRLPDLELVSERRLIIAPNLGLNRPVALTASTEAKGQVSLSTRADASRLTFTCDLQGPEMILPPLNGGPAWQLEVNLDARSYGKRLEDGSTAPVRVTGPAEAGKGSVQPVPAWAFGTGYGALFDPKVFQAALSSSGADRHQIQLSLPRSYLYLHEWALGNGNSQLGLQVRLTLNTAQGWQTWSLMPTSKPANSIGSHAVLELADQPTSRATVVPD